MFRRTFSLVCFIACLQLMVSLPAYAASGFATSVHSYLPGVGVPAGFDDTARALGGPTGEGTANGSLDVVVLGVGGSITLQFAGSLFDGPGPDLTVFENGFSFGGGFYGELAFVEVSSDAIHWARFASDCHIPGPLGLFDTYDASLVQGLAGNAPIFANVVSNLIDPFDAAVSGGDAFDLASLSADAAVVGGLVNLQDIQYVRLVDVYGDGSTLATTGNPIYDPTSATASFDLDAVAALHLDVTVTVQEHAWGRVKALYR
jgi:hypothetical protein